MQPATARVWPPITHVNVRMDTIMQHQALEIVQSLFRQQQQRKRQQQQ